MIDDRPASAHWIINTTPDSFDSDVLERSRATPVVVDFWAEWCAPCRMLAPTLEKLTNEFDGKFILVKANTEEVSAAAGRFNVQGIPAVYGVVDGEIVDFFVGVLPEDQIRTWLERTLAAGALSEAKRLEKSAPEEAETKYRELIVASPRDVDVKIGLARTLLAQEKIGECQALINELADRGFLEPDAEKIKSALELRGKPTDNVDERRAEAEAHPDDLELQFRLAESLAGAERFEEAMDICLTLVQKDRQGIGESARKLMLNIFRVLPDDSELTTTYRRKLSMALY